MNYLKSRNLVLFSISILVLLLAGCASPVERSAMVPKALVVGATHPQTVKVLTLTEKGDDSEKKPESAFDENFKGAIEDAITQSKIFSSIVQGKDGDYELTVKSVKLNAPSFGLTFTVEIENTWTLTRVSDKSIALNTNVKSSGTATFSDAFSGNTRIRLAGARSVQDNINQGVKLISELKL
jgi:PBP1b-binding outer membrane lipoprotein LpoB